VTQNLTLDVPDNSADQWAALVYASGDHEFFEKKFGRATRENVRQFLTFDREYPNSILSCVTAARENARSVREEIGSDMWEHLNHFYLTVRDAAAGGLEGPLDFYQYVKDASHLFTGVTIATFSQGEAWHFARLGRVLERADKTSRMLDVKYFLLLPSVTDVGTPMDDLQWSAVLRSMSGFEMFRKRHHAITPTRVVGFLVLDRQFPRAILHCVDVANSSLHAISGSPEDTFWNIAEQRIGQLRSELAYITVEGIIRTGLHEFLDSLQTKLNRVGDGIDQVFITMAPTE
jgi:uncharacterized alpha-E superfamily protein